MSNADSPCRRGTHVRTTAFDVNTHLALHDSGRQRATPYRDAGMRSPPARARAPNSTSTASRLQPALPDGRASTSDVRFLSTRFIPHESPQSTPPLTTTPAIRTPAARAMRDSSVHAQRPLCAYAAQPRMREQGLNLPPQRPPSCARTTSRICARTPHTRPRTTAARAGTTLRSACAHAYTVSALQAAQVATNPHAMRAPRFLSHASLRILFAAQTGGTLSTYAPGVVLRPRSGYAVPRWRAIAPRRRQATVVSDSMYDSAPAHVADLCARIPAHNGSPRADPDAHHHCAHTIPRDNNSPPYHCASILPHRLAPSPRVAPCPRAHPSSWTSGHVPRRPRSASSSTLPCLLLLRCRHLRHHMLVDPRAVST
ncbi:hypothetical protein C8R44DRAFT_895169 [Mycena epipterygia]|nr:hypothetical protein C8R44DRAFT_895169 [Mycena epipterygia]